MGKIEKQEVLVQNIFDKVGGPENVKDVYHCATRMRLTLHNQDAANINDLKTISNIKGALWSNGELQLIIGPEVSQITALFKNNLKSEVQNNNKNNTDFNVKAQIQENNVSIWRKFIKSVSAIFGPLIPFLIGVGLIMALQQLLIRSGVASDPAADGSQLGIDYNIFDYVLNVIASTGFKMMGVVAMWSTVRYLGGKTPIAIALALIMVSPIIPEAGIDLIKLGSWEIVIKPFYSTILVFIAMGVIIAYAQKSMERYFHPVANFLLNPFLTLFVGGLLAFFIMGPIMGVVENALLTAFDWFMNMPIGLGTLIVGLTWQPLVVLGVHNILFFAAVASLKEGTPSLFLAAAFAAAWAQMGATIAVGIKSRKIIDRSAAFAAALPGLISGPTESCIYGVNLPKGIPFLTGVLAGGIGGWLIGIFNVSLDNLAGLGGIVGFLAYTDDLVAAILIDLASFGLGILVTYLFWKEEKTEKSLALKTTLKLAKQEFLIGQIDFSARNTIKLIKKSNNKKVDKEELIKELEKNKVQVIKLNKSLEPLIINFILNLRNDVKNSKLTKDLLNMLKEVKTERQIELNKIYLELKNNVKLLKELNQVTKKHYKLTVKKTNLEYTINRFLELREEKNASLFNKGQKLLNTNISFKTEKGNLLILESEKNNYKLEKIETLKNQVSELNKIISDSQKNLEIETNKYYVDIEKNLNQIEKVKEKKLKEFKNQYFDDIHYLEIKENLIKAKAI
ncbi:PTS transporter subunit EIIB [Spiroplasma taiwanense]|uniref:PTS system sucrose-specific IIBC component n=1 Tax=Spiroplasma taiwanense CT-1 TaxID=1276220 RepID=S5MCA9_9MOLU|nr:PTS transporter subunit EIIB [Spiroplasma taiwanense]AGR41373.1 PTS system sucrose-specific IIBC component [Spiroplasma taiwanense CT-1]